MIRPSLLKLTQKKNLDAFTCHVGSIIDLDTGIVYGSRTECIEALGREVAVPIFHSRKKHKRLRIITMADRMKAMYERGAAGCSEAGIEINLTLNDLSGYAIGGWTAEKFDDVKNLIDHHCEMMSEIADKIGEAGRALGRQETLEEFQNDFSIEQSYITGERPVMVHRL